MRRDILYLHEPSCLRGISPSDIIDANAGDLEKVEKHRVLDIGTQERLDLAQEIESIRSGYKPGLCFFEPAWTTAKATLSPILQWELSR